MAVNSPKYSVETWNEIKARFESGTFVSLKELASEYSVNPVTLRTRMLREGWNERQRTLQNKVELVVEKKALSMAEEVLETGYKRSKRFHAIVDASLAQLGTNSEGIPIAEPDDIDKLSKAELRIHDWQKSCARIAPVAQQVEHSGSVNIQHSLVQTIQRLREGKDVPTLKDSEKQGFIDVEIEPRKTS